MPRPSSFRSGAGAGSTSSLRRRGPNRFSPPPPISRRWRIRRRDPCRRAPSCGGRVLQLTLCPQLIARHRKDQTMKGRLLKHLTSVALISVLGVVLLTTASAATSLKTGLKVFVIPKNLGNPYFTTADSVKSGGALKALLQLKESGTETSGTAATAASQIPAIQAAITKGANALIVSATDASALCPTLKQAMAKKIADRKSVV